MRKAVLRINGGFLLLVGLAQVIFELLSHYLGIGPLSGRFVNSAFTIGFVEAHGLAALIGILLIKASFLEPQRFWHLFAAAVHLFLGSANVVFWDSFVQMDFVVPGIVATIFHGIFLIAQSYCFYRSYDET